MAPILFLDRDGVINADSPDFIKSVDEWQPLPGSLEAIARLNRAGFEIVVITNQSGIARGLFDESALGEIHTEMSRCVELAGGRLAGIYYCPHAPEDGCACRKPMPGLIEQACAQLEVQAQGVPFIGDRLSDLVAARRAGCTPILVRSGLETPTDLEAGEWENVPVHRNLAEAADALLAIRAAEGQGG